MKIQLFQFADCPNVEAARDALREAMAAEAIDEPVEEIDVEAATTPESLRGWGSPTILIDGEDVGGGAPAAGASCRRYESGVPTVAEIRARLRVRAGSAGSPE